MNTLNVRDVEIEIRSDLRNYGPKDDGTPFIGEEFYIVAITKRGDVFRHYRTLPGAARDIHDETGEPYFTDLRGWAKAYCEAVVKKIKERGVINLTYWTRSRPEYGSKAYVEYGAEEDLRWEADT